jgi:AbrB family looped-hinge helix DNA binding protein
MGLTIANWHSILPMEGIFMRSTVDKFGRITLPKAMRLHLGIDLDTPLEIKEEEDGISIRVAQQEAPTSFENGLLVYTGKPVGDLNAVLDEIRKNRLEEM